MTHTEKLAYLDRAFNQNRRSLPGFLQSGGEGLSNLLQSGLGSAQRFVGRNVGGDVGRTLGGWLGTMKKNPLTTAGVAVGAPLLLYGLKRLLSSPPRAQYFNPYKYAHVFISEKQAAQFGRMLLSAGRKGMSTAGRALRGGEQLTLGLPRGPGIGGLRHWAGQTFQPMAQKAMPALRDFGSALGQDARTVGRGLRTAWNNPAGRSAMLGAGAAGLGAAGGAYGMHRYTQNRIQEAIPQWLQPWIRQFGSPELASYLNA